MQTTSPKAPRAAQLDRSGPGRLRSGGPILTLCAVLWLWLTSLVWRFLEPDLQPVSFGVSVALALWFIAQVILMRRGVVERGAFAFTSILQALTPTLLIAFWVLGTDTGRMLATLIAQRVTIFEMVSLHMLRLAAWGTVKKYRQKQLPRYFFLFGSIPDFAFAIGAVALTGLIWAGVFNLSAMFLIVWSLVGMAAFLGAATTMYFGVPGTVLSFRWAAVERGEEPPTLLPFRWPMSLAPAFCAPVFWLAHMLLIFKLMA
ncbi:MAG: hypothetical protein AAFV74_11925 [Pseudomonadota bacterium]